MQFHFPAIAMLIDYTLERVRDKSTFRSCFQIVGKVVNVLKVSEELEMF